MNTEDQERHAYVSGDVKTAELLAKVLELEEELATLENCKYGLEEELGDTKTALANLTAAYKALEEELAEANKARTALRDALESVADLDCADEKTQARIAEVLNNF